MFRKWTWHVSLRVSYCTVDYFGLNTILNDSFNSSIGAFCRKIQLRGKMSFLTSYATKSLSTAAQLLFSLVPAIISAIDVTCDTLNHFRTWTELIAWNLKTVEIFKEIWLMQPLCNARHMPCNFQLLKGELLCFASVIGITIITICRNSRKHLRVSLVTIRVRELVIYNLLR
jgi:hypothetical protein